MKRLITLTCLLMCALIMLPLVSVDAHAEVATRNGDFSAGGSQWNINPAIPPTWNPFSGGAAALHPPNAYSGEVLYQNLNVTGIGGKTVSFACTLSKLFAPQGNTIAIYLDYIDKPLGTDIYVSERLVSPANDAITTNTPVSNNSFVFPATARKLVKLRIVKEGYGEFTIDNIQLAATGITVGPVPQISAISATSGNYGTSVTITGTGFGQTQGGVRVGGGSATVTSWSDTSVVATISEPVSSGPLLVVTDFTESNNNHSFSVTSPHYTVNAISPSVRVIKGQAAEFVLNVAFMNGFSSLTGVSFTATGLPGGATHTFSPVPVKRSGGTVMRINTAGVTPGTYPITINANEATTVTRTIPVTLVVTTTTPGSIVFPYNDGTSTTNVTSLTVSGQKKLIIVPVATAADGMPISTELVLTSSNPTVLGVYKNSWMGYDIYAHETGNANLIATAPDGVSASLPINITVPGGSRVSISLIPQTITNKYTDAITQSTAVTLSGDQWYSVGYMGMISLIDDTRDFAYPQNPPTYYYGGTFKINHDQTQLGTYLFYGDITASYGGPLLYENVQPLTITNDPSYAGLNVGIRSLDPSIQPMMYEHFTAEFYSEGGVLQFSRTHSSYDMDPTNINLVGAITPGSYKVKIVPMSTDVLPQWYPNADSLADAQLLTFTAGATDGPRYFFARKAPDTTPPYITGFTVPATATSLTVTGIVLSAYDQSGVAAYCLTETNDAATCTWQQTPPTQYAFASQGTKTLYAFAKDTIGNVSVTDPYSTAQVTISLGYTLTLQFGGTGDGQVNGDLSCDSSTTCAPVLFSNGATVTLLATADTVSSFTGWTGCTTVNGNICTVSMTADRTVTATFAALPPVAAIARNQKTYARLQDTLDAAQNNDQILTRATATPITENLIYNRAGISVTVKGGYDATFTTSSGLTVVDGYLKIRGGRITANKLYLR